jgi:citronellol/citronellal dehydrogenase
MAEHGGAIVNVVADMWGSMVGMGHSGAARAGMVSFTETAAVEWAASGVRVNAVAPGAIASSGFDTYPDWMQPHLASAHAAIPAARLGTESEVSAAICFLLSPAAAFISGSVLRVDGAAPNARLASPLSALRDKDAPLPIPWPLDVHDRSVPWHGFHRGRRIHRWGGSK